MASDLKGDSTSFMVNAAGLRMLVTRLSRFVAGDGQRPVLECIKLEADRDCLRGIAADGFVLGIQEIEYSESPKEAAQALFRPRPILAALRGLRSQSVAVPSE